MLTISPDGRVLQSDANASEQQKKYWPQVRDEVNRWRFVPFEVNGKPVTARVQEYAQLVPAERLPARHTAAPHLRPDSKVTITLNRSVCMKTCPAYTVSIDTDGITFFGKSGVVAEGRHQARISAGEVRGLAKRFIDADFYSMNDLYGGLFQESHTYMLSISIGGTKKVVQDSMGALAGMPTAITELEDDVDDVAHTKRWIEGSDGLVPSLRAEHYNFHTADAQAILKAAASSGRMGTVRALLAAGVPLHPLSHSKSLQQQETNPFEKAGWLIAAYSHPEILNLLIADGASNRDQADKDLALAAVARRGDLQSFRRLVLYGANPNVDLSKLLAAQNARIRSVQSVDAGSVLLNAVQSGNPELVREVLRYHPNLEARGDFGRTAISNAVTFWSQAREKDQVACLRLILAARPNINTRDDQGDTPLHIAATADTVKALIDSGADVNARNNRGETPLFMTHQADAIPILVMHGAKLSARNNLGQTALEAAERQHLPTLAALKTVMQR